MSVVGFDIGNDTSVIAAVKHRGIDVLLKDESKRETPSAVSFTPKQRLLSSSAAASALSNPKSTLHSSIKRLLGRPFHHPSVQADLRLLLLPSSLNPADGSVLLHLPDGQTFSPVQILAMILSLLKEIAEKDLNAAVSDCVVGIPSYFTDLQRRSYLHAAAIAGLKPLRLLHDTTAIALGYGIYKNDLQG